MSIGLAGLGDLYKCTSDVLGLPLTQQGLSLHQHEKCVNVLLDTTSTLLDTCTATRDIVLQLKEATNFLRSSLPSKMTDSSIESSISNYISSRKRIVKSAKGLVLSLKQVDEMLQPEKVLDNDHHQLTMPCKPKSNKWSLVSKLMQRREIEWEEQAEKGNELDNVDAALRAFCFSKTAEAKKLQSVDITLEALDKGVESIEKGLDSVSRQLIETRASLSSIISF
ncbi:hypothetical protein Ancab_003101 [Ancistrocladus abbreviatus]